MQSVSCLWLRVGGTGRSQQLSTRRPNWSTPTGVYWTISSGVTKSLNTPTTVRRYTAQHPKHLLFTRLSYADMLQALVWCHTATYRSDWGTTQVKKRLKMWFSYRKHICVYNLSTKCPLMLFNVWKMSLLYVYAVLLFQSIPTLLTTKTCTTTSDRPLWI